MSERYPPEWQPEEKTEAEYIGRIREQYDRLSKAQKRVAKYITAHQQELAGYSITMLAQKTNTAPSTITRFCQTLSYKGFNELKVYIAKGMLNTSAMQEPIREDDSLSVMLQKLDTSTQKALRDTLRITDEQLISKTVDALLNARNILLVGHSGGYVSALRGQQLLARASISSQAINDAMDAELISANLNENDAVICISYSGESRVAVRTAYAGKAQGAKIIAITATSNSTLDRVANYTLFYSHDIPDDVQYMYIASVCETELLGIITAELMRRPEHKKKLDKIKKVILSNRVK